jgi:hypothetical protein
MFKPGLNTSPPRGAAAIDSVMTRLSVEGVPVVHLSEIDVLAQRYGLPLQPRTIPTVGQGKIFFREVHNRWIVLVVFFSVLLMLIALVRLDWGYRLLSAGGRERTSNRPEPMV